MGTSQIFLSVKKQANNFEQRQKFLKSYFSSTVEKFEIKTTTKKFCGGKYFDGYNHRCKLSLSA